MPSTKYSIVPEDSPPVTKKKQLISTCFVENTTNVGNENE